MPPLKDWPIVRDPKGTVLGIASVACIWAGLAVLVFLALAALTGWLQ